MDPHDTLTTITIAGLATSFIAGVTSKIWKDAVEIQGQLTKRLTPAGWLSFGIALIGLSGSVASELIRVSIRSGEQLQTKAEAAQKQALQDQEMRWRKDTSAMLAATKQGIETNLGGTINGFQATQASSLQHMHEIIVAGQPLTSLSLHWRLASENPSLWQTMKKGQDEIQENSESSQGGVPEVPFDTMEYGAALLPLFSYIARIGDTPKADRSSQQEKSVAHSSIVVLVTLDESPMRSYPSGILDMVEPGVKTLEEGRSRAALHRSTRMRGMAIRRPRALLPWRRTAVTACRNTQLTGILILSLSRTQSTERTRRSCQRRNFRGSSTLLFFTTSALYPSSRTTSGSHMPSTCGATTSGIVDTLPSTGGSQT